jgi:hypothetical protein
MIVHFRLFLAIGSLSVVGALHAQPPLPPPDDPSPSLPPGQPGVKVAEKGPIHEAFAQPGSQVRGKEMTAPKAPPPSVNEVPPDSKPDGTNVKWIPGYWQWDAAANDFIWVSGFYRNVPPNREWQAGQWVEKDGKFVYQPGFWKQAGPASTLGNLPEPPKAIESGPSTPNDNPDAMWVPGGWEYRNGQFAWRSGYWAAPYRNMMWQPGQYVCRDQGYTYVPGYWDYPLENRGLLYAPVYIDPQVILNPNWSYTPQYGLNVGEPGGYGNGGFFGSLYYGPNYNNYYYGDYGNPYGLGGFGYGGLGDPLFGYGGYYPWWYGGGYFYNPLWNHYRWLNRGNRGWGEGARGGRGGHTGTHNGGTVARGTTVSPRGVGTTAHAAGVAAISAAHTAVSSASGSIVRPAGQVLAAQSQRGTIVSSGVRSAGAGVVIPGSSPLVRTYSGGVVQAGGMTIHSGVNSFGIPRTSIYNYATDPGSHASSFHSSSNYHSSGGITHSSGGRSGGGGGGSRGGHR